MYTQVTAKMQMRKKRLPCADAGALDCLKIRNAIITIHTHHFLDFSLGAGLRGMRKRALIGCISQRAKGLK